MQELIYEHNANLIVFALQELRYKSDANLVVFYSIIYIPPKTYEVKFDKVIWHTITDVICHPYVLITKEIYNFILKLPNLKRLRFNTMIGCNLLITYNTKFFKHKLLRIYNEVHHRIATDITTRIIFII